MSANTYRIRISPEVINGDVWLNDKYQKDYSDFIKERNW